MSDQNRTTPAPESATTVYNCPDWCVRTDHDADEVGPGNPPIHYAPEIGAVSPQSDLTTPQVVLFLDGAGECTFTDPAEIRRVAADLVRGAEWLEARR